MKDHVHLDVESERSLVPVDEGHRFVHIIWKRKTCRVTGVVYLNLEDKFITFILYYV